MARSIETIYSLIIAEKESRTELQGLSSASASAIWRLWAWVTAAVLYTVEVMHDLFKIEIETMLKALKPGTLLWYQEMCKAFQYGDALIWQSGAYGYATISNAHKIIDQCSVTEGNGGLVIKIATEVSDELEPLSVAQENAFRAYLWQMKYAGTRISLVNIQANKLHIVAAVYYDPLILKADGSDITDDSKPVELAIKNYLRELPFNGRLKKTALIDAILAAQGVFDVNISTLEHKYGTNAYQSIVVSKIPESGYFKIDTAYPLASTITYVANV